MATFDDIARLQKNVDMDAPDIYTDCRTLYNTDLSGKRYDVVFMDIDFSGENNIARLFSDSYAVRERCSDGLALGTYLRHILGHQNFDIIYVTSHENYAIHAIPIRPANQLSLRSFAKKFTFPLPLVRKRITRQSAG